MKFQANHISFWDNEVLNTGKRTFRFIMTPHMHHWDNMMMFEETTKSLFPSDLFIQPGDNKPVISEDLSDAMIQLYRAVGIFGSEEPVRQTTRRIVKLEPKMKSSLEETYRISLAMAKELRTKKRL